MSGQTRALQRAPRPRRLRRWRRVGLICAVVLVVAHTPPFQHAATGVVAAVLSSTLGGRVSMGSLRYRLWSGYAEARAVHVALAGFDLTIGRVELEATPWRGLHAQVAEPRLTAIVPPAGATVQPSQGRRPWTTVLRFDAIEVRGGAVRLQDASGRKSLSLEGIDIRSRRAGDTARATLDVAALEIVRPGHTWRGPVDASMTASIAGATGSLELASMDVRVADASVEASGEIAQIAPLVARARVTASTGSALVRALAPGVEFDGSVGAQATLQSDRDGRRGAVTLDARALRLRDVGPLDARAAVRLQDGTVLLEQVLVTGYGAAFEGTGRVDRGPGPVQLRGNVRDLEVARLLRQYLPDAPDFASRLAADVSVRAPTWRVDDLAMVSAEAIVSLTATRGRGVPVAGTARVELNKGELTIASADLRARTARVRANGRVFIPGPATLKYEVSTDLGALADVARDLGTEMPPIPARGPLSVTGDIDRSHAGWSGSAVVSGRGLAVHEMDFDVDAALRISPAGIVVDHVTASGADVSLTASGAIPVRAGDRWNIQGDVHDLRLTDLCAAYGVPIALSTRGGFEIAGSRTEPTLAFTMTGSAEPASPGAAADVSSPARFSYEGTASRATVAVRELRGRVGGAPFEGNGTWAPGSGALDARLDATAIPIRALSGIARAIDADGTIDATLQLEGTAAAPAGRARVVATRNTWRGVPLPDLSLDLTAAGKTLAIAATTGDLPLLSGHAGLQRPWPLRLDIDLRALPLDPVLQGFPHLAAAGPTLSLSGRGVLNGPLASLGDLRFDARVDGVTGRLITPVQSSPFTVRASRDALTLEGIELRVGDSHLRASGTIAEGASVPPLTLRGEIPLSALVLAGLADDAAGIARLEFSLTGRPERPAATGTVHVDGGMLRAGRVQVDEVNVAGTVKPHQITIASATARAGGGAIRLDGSVQFGERASASGITVAATRIDLARWLADVPGLSAVVDVEGTLTADRLALDAIHGGGTLAAVDVSTTGKSLGLASPVGWTIKSGRLTHAPLRLVGTGVDLDIEAHVDAGGQTPQAAVRADGSIDLEFLSPLLEGAGAIDGDARLKTAIDWLGGGWRIDGEASVTGGRLSLLQPQLSITGVDATLRGAGTRVDIVTGTGQIGDGRVSFDGHASATAEGIETMLQLRADNVPLEHPVGLRSRSSGTLTFSGKGRALRLGGTVVVHQAAYEVELDKNAQALDRVAAALAAIDGRGSARDRVQLDVGVRLEEGLRVTNSQVGVVIDGTLRLGGTLLTPEVGGSLTLREGGMVRLSRAQVRLQSGRAELAGYPMRPPEVDIQGTTQVTGVNIDLSLSGPLDDLQMTLASPNRADLSQGDLASLILTGRTATAAGSESGAIMVEEVASAFGRALDRRLGGLVMVDVSRDESLVAEDANPTQRLNIGVPLNSWLSVIYSRSLDRESLRWIVDVKPRRDLRVRLISNDDGSEAVEASHRFSARLWARRADRAPPPRRRIRHVRFAGAPPSEARELQSRMKLETGAPYDYFSAEDAAKRGQSWLASRGYRAAVIDVQETPAGSEVDLTIDVRPGPPVAIEWRGDDPGRGIRNRIRGEWGTFHGLDERAALFAREATRALQASRYYSARATGEIVHRPDGSVLAVFDVRRGVRGAGVDVHVRGNRSVSEAVLAAALPAPGTPAFFDLLAPEGRARLATAIRLACAREGHLEASIDQVEAAVDPATTRLQVTISVTEGPRAIVGRVDVPDEIRRALAGGPPLQLREGVPFAFEALSSDRARLLSWYHDEGYPDALVEGVIEPSAAGLLIRFAATPGPHVRVGSVRQAREGRTRPTVFAGAVVPSPGEPVRLRDLEDSRERLSETRVFRSVDVRLDPTSRAGVRDVVIDAVERNGLDVEYSLRYTAGGNSQAGETPSDAQPGLQVGAGVEAVNPFGLAHRYRLYGLIGAERRVIGARHESASFFGLRLATQLSVFDDTDRVRDSPQFADRVTGTTFQQTRRWRLPEGRRFQDRLRMQWGYSFKHIEYTDLVTGETLGGLRAGPFYTIGGDLRDSVTDPHRGLFWSIGAELALRPLGSDVNYVRTYGQVFSFVPIGPRVVWAQAFRAGFVPGDDPQLLLENRFVAGGSSTVRGFSENALGPHGPEGAALGGQAVAIFNQELRFPVWNRLFGGVFYDAGNVFTLARDFDVSALRHSAGAGLRVMFPFGPVRVDWAHVIKPREGEKKARVIFSIGHVF